jgi:hypothetical protein
MNRDEYVQRGKERERERDRKNESVIEQEEIGKKGRAIQREVKKEGREERK